MMWQSSSGFGTTHPEDPSGRNPHQNSPHISRLQVLRPAPGPLPVSLANAVKPLLGEAATFRRLSADTLFFCFYFQQACPATKSFTMKSPYYLLQHRRVRATGPSATSMFQPLQPYVASDQQLSRPTHAWVQ